MQIPLLTGLGDQGQKGRSKSHGRESEWVREIQKEEERRGVPRTEDEKKCKGQMKIFQHPYAKKRHNEGTERTAREKKNGRRRGSVSTMDTIMREVRKRGKNNEEKGDGGVKVRVEIDLERLRKNTTIILSKHKGKDGRKKWGGKKRNSQGEKNQEGKPSLARRIIQLMKFQYNWEGGRGGDGGGEIKRGGHKEKSHGKNPETFIIEGLSI